jgi:predicted component of type VI protein secretion system
MNKILKVMVLTAAATAILAGCSNRNEPEPTDLGKVVTEASRANAANTQRDIHNRVRPGNI